MKNLTRLAATAALLCLLALVATGCGSSSNKALSYSAFVSQANAICKKVGTQTQAAVAAKKYDDIMSAGSSAMKQLKALTPPAELKDAYATYLTAQQKTIDLTQPVVDALKKGDQTAAQAAQAAQATANTASNAAANAAGVGAVCGSDS